MLKVIALSIITIFNNMMPEEYLNKRIETIFPFYDKYKNETYYRHDPKRIQYQITEEYIFYEKKAKYYNVYTDLDNRIESFSFFIDEIINIDFFNKLKDKYGEPDYMFKMGKITQTSKKTDTDGTTLISGKAEGQPCSFQEKPLCICWQNEVFELKINIHYENKTTHIVFKNS